MSQHRSTHLLSIIFALCCAANPSTAGTQDSLSNSCWTLLPDQPLFNSLLANLQEPRLGIRKEVGSSRMRLDIGGAIDLLELSLPNKDHLRLGAAMFTYALTTSRQGLRLQVDAVDGFFGGYLMYGSSSLVARLRILHHSAHYVDGHVDPSTQWWLNGDRPEPYTRDFAELLVALEWRIAQSYLSAYTGVSYATLVRPSEIRRIASLHGIEWHMPDFPGSALGRPVNVYAAYNLTLSGIPKYVGTSALETGVKLGEWSKSGVRIFLGYQNGLEVFGQYFRVRRTSWTLGFGFDL